MEWLKRLETCDTVGSVMATGGVFKINFMEMLTKVQLCEIKLVHSCRNLLQTSLMPVKCMTNISLSYKAYIQKNYIAISGVQIISK